MYMYKYTGTGGSLQVILLFPKQNSFNAFQQTGPVQNPTV